MKWEAFTEKRFSGWWAIRVVETHNEVGSGDGGFEEVDARLMAAAPDLLEALEDARFALYGDGPAILKLTQLFGWLKEKFMSIELEKTLASLLGWTNVRQSHFYGDPRLAGTFEGKDTFLPRWTEDDGEAFRLICAYNIDISHTNDLEATDELHYCTVTATNQDGESFVEYELENLAAATRKAVVRAVIEKLENASALARTSEAKKLESAK